MRGKGRDEKGTQENRAHSFGLEKGTQLFFLINFNSRTCHNMKINIFIDLF